MTIKGIATVTLPPSATQSFACEEYMRRPGDSIVNNYVEFKELGITLRTFLGALASSSTRSKAARALWVEGPPGGGKTTSLLIACLTSNRAVASISASKFAGAHEGDSVKILYELLPELELWSQAYRLHVVIMVDDLDLSIAGDPNATATINKGLLIQELMKLCDEKHRILSFDGTPMPLVFSVNDATGMRASLTRPGRAQWYSHVPSTEEKMNVAYRVLTPQTGPERALVEALAQKFAASQSVAFWEALATRIRQRLAEPHFAKVMPNQAEIERIYAGRVPLFSDVAWAAARELRKHRIKNYLAKRFTLPWGRA